MNGVCSPETTANSYKGLFSGVLQVFASIFYSLNGFSIISLKSYLKFNGVATCGLMLEIEDVGINYWKCWKLFRNLEIVLFIVKSEGRSRLFFILFIDRYLSFYFMVSWSYLPILGQCTFIYSCPTSVLRFL